jgi:hypothetical protein
VQWFLCFVHVKTPETPYYRSSPHTLCLKAPLGPSNPYLGSPAPVVLILHSGSHCLLLQSYGIRDVLSWVAPKIDTCLQLIIQDSSVEALLLAMASTLSLEHTPSVPQGIGSDELLKGVRMIMCLVYLVVLECLKE